MAAISPSQDPGAAAKSEVRDQAERLYWGGWRAFPFQAGALMHHDERRSKAHVSDPIWTALREYELDASIASNNPRQPTRAGRRYAPDEV